jgi:hypothetical protein
VLSPLDITPRVFKILTKFYMVKSSMKCHETQIIDVFSEICVFNITGQIFVEKSEKKK